MSFLGNTIVFLDTGFFKKYKAKEASYQKLFSYSVAGGVILCTSRLCFEEWRTQKIQNLQDNLRTWDHNIASHRGENYFSKLLFDTEIYSDLRAPDELKKRSKEIIEELILIHKIKCYESNEAHIDPTWEGYFHGTPPYKSRKNTRDIPDAWIFEGAKDALNDPEHTSLKNKLCLTGDETMRGALSDLGFTPTNLEDLIGHLNKEKEGITSKAEKQEESLISAAARNIDVPVDHSSPLDILLAKSPNSSAREIYLRLLGFVIPLNTPTHESLVNAVVARGYDKILTEACAIILSDESKPYIKNTGSHYIAGDKAACNEATSRLTLEIIEMLNGDGDGN